jgi:hypothetical protein
MIGPGGDDMVPKAKPSRPAEQYSSLESVLKSVPALTISLRLLKIDSILAKIRTALVESVTNIEDAK